MVSIIYSFIVIWSILALRTRMSELEEVNLWKEENLMDHLENLQHLFVNQPDDEDQSIDHEDRLTKFLSIPHNAS